jgi:pimeloyl-ACP methyl ester carboxylesterase
MPIEWKDGGETRFVTGLATLEGRCFGPAPSIAPTILMLHEGLGCVALWRDFPAKLASATGFGVFAYSREGYGRSTPTPLPRPLDYMTREAVGPLREVIDWLGPKRLVLLGHSDGASIAALYLGHVPDHRVRGLILMAPHFFTEPMGLKSIAEAKAAYETGALRQRLAKYHADVDNAFYGWRQAWLDPGFANWDITDAIDYIRTPVLAIQGRQDQYGTLAQIEALNARLLSPFERIILDDCRHAPFVDKPKETLDAIVDFLSRLDRIDATKPFARLREKVARSAG